MTKVAHGFTRNVEQKKKKQIQHREIFTCIRQHWLSIAICKWTENEHCFLCYINAIKPSDRKNLLICQICFVPLWPLKFICSASLSHHIYTIHPMHFIFDGRSYFAGVALICLGFFPILRSIACCTKCFFAHFINNIEQCSLNTHFHMIRFFH